MKSPETRSRAPALRGSGFTRERIALRQFCSSFCGRTRRSKFVLSDASMLDNRHLPGPTFWDVPRKTIFTGRDPPWR